MPRKEKKPPRRSGPGNRRVDHALRIIGGKFRGRLLAYDGDPRTRPMKDRVRQAIFDLLGPSIKGRHAIDLFAGTGAMGLEAISRGAARATLVERRVPAVKTIQENISVLGVETVVEVLRSDTFFWVAQQTISAERPWATFCCPPYDLYIDQCRDMLDLIRTMLLASPPQSVFVVESDKRFDVAQLPNPDDWDVRHYSPACIAIHWKDTQPLS